MTEPRKIKLRFAGKCKSCGAELDKGVEALHYKEEKKVACLRCAEASSPATPMVGVQRPEQLAQALPGTSAKREYDRRSEKRRDELEGRWGGKLGKLVWMLEDERQSTAAWRIGARGEREVGEFLEKKLDGRRCELLHDRAIPGSKANIDHIVIGPSGVTVIDAKNIKGKVRADWTGIGKRKRTFLTVNGRDRSKLIDGVKKQVAIVSALLEDLQPPVEIHSEGVICWWHYEGLPIIGTNSIEIDGVRVLNPKGTAQVASAEGEYSDALISVVADFLDSRLRPA